MSANYKQEGHWSNYVCTVIPIISGIRVASTHILAASSRGGREFTQPLLKHGLVIDVPSTPNVISVNLH